jgi:maltose alpha-D-glucosyltransferase / alpha-amylase
MRSDQWYKNAIVYCVDVDSFRDSNGDGHGDFCGLTESLDYLAGLGVTCVWLLPFYPTPDRDNGYDVMDYYSVDPRLGTLGDFVIFLREAKERGMRVIIDLVVNHTSDQHPWFQEARRDKHSRFRDFYVWRKDDPGDTSDQVVFPGQEDSIWDFDPEAEAYYLHRFYKHQPDLNISNPAVRHEICKIMGFWLQLGVSGFRMDAAPFIIEHLGPETEGTPPGYGYLREFRDFLSWRSGDAIMLAEANVTTDVMLEYFGDGDRMHMMFNFLANQALFLSLVRQDPKPLVKTLRKLPPLPDRAQWAMFARNHDELDLGRLTDKERQEVFAEFGPEKEMQLYDRGIRRRLAPMLAGDRDRLALVYSLMFTLPGTPVLWYGEEIGMGDDLSLQERDSVRTPMQWSPQENGGFSSAHPGKLVRPVISGGKYGYKKVNVEQLQRDRRSLLNVIENMARLRKECPEFGWGTSRILNTKADAVLAHTAEWREGLVLAVHNFSRRAAALQLPLASLKPQFLASLMTNDRDELPRDGVLKLNLKPFEYRWFRLRNRVAEGTQ